MIYLLRHTQQEIMRALLTAMMFSRLMPHSNGALPAMIKEVILVAFLLPLPDMREPLGFDCRWRCDLFASYDAAGIGYMFYSRRKSC